MSWGQNIAVNILQTFSFIFLCDIFLYFDLNLPTLIQLMAWHREGNSLNQYQPNLWYRVTTSVFGELTFLSVARVSEFVFNITPGIYTI